MAYVAAMASEDEAVLAGRYADLREYRKRAAVRYLKLKQLGAPATIIRNERRRILMSIGR